jgi:hypothetical protein
MRTTARKAWEDWNLCFQSSLGTPMEPRNDWADWKWLCYARDLTAGAGRCQPHGEGPVVVVETTVETTGLLTIFLSPPVYLETAGQHRCPERDSNPYDLSVWEV